MTDEHDSTTSVGADAHYDFAAIQEKWLPVWEKLQPFRTDDVSDKRPRKYVLDMFPYPSGDLHMGHAEAFGFGDIVARYWRQQGFNVLHPIGWDSFGLPAENAAIKRGIDPRDWTYSNIAQQKRSFRLYAPSFEWERELHTSDPEYYRWTQWLFLKLYEKGLAYRKAGLVNWCPYDQTVLANEQVVDGHCERCGHQVTKKKLTQWYFRVTDYGDRLLDDLNQLESTWPAKVLSMQRNWIGRSLGADVQFEIEGRQQRISVYTTRPDTLYGATFMVVAPDSDLAAELVDGAGEQVKGEFADYLDAARAQTEIERLSTEREKTGVFLERYAINPLSGEHSRVRYNTLEPKLFQLLAVTGALPGSVLSVQASSSTGEDPSPVTLTGAEEYQAKFKLLLDKAEWAAVRFDFAATSGGQDFLMRSWQMFSQPAPIAQKLIQLPLLCADFELDARGNRMGYEGYGAERLSALELGERGGGIYTIEYRNLGPVANELVTLEKISYQRINSVPRSGGGDRDEGGIILLQVRTVR